MATTRLRLASTCLLALALGATMTRTAAAQTGGAVAPGTAPSPQPPPPPAPPPPPPGGLSVPPPPPAGPGPAPAAPPPAYAPAPVYAPPPPGSAPTEIAPAQTESPKRFGMFLDPVNLLLGTFGAEVAISPAMPISINLGFQYRKDDIANDPFSGAKIDLTQYGARVGVQIFPTTDRTMRGFYLYPRGTYVKGSTNATQVYNEADTSGVELAGMAGYQWRWNNGFAIRLGGGVAYRKIEVELTTKPGFVTSQTKAGREGPAPLIEFALGWCF